MRPLWGDVFRWRTNFYDGYILPDDSKLKLAFDSYDPFYEASLGAHSAALNLPMECASERENCGRKTLPTCILVFSLSRSRRQEVVPWWRGCRKVQHLEHNLALVRVVFF
jgi:hypothetical protein